MPRTLLRGKDWITTQDWSRAELETALALAQDLKVKFASGEPHELLRAKTNYLIFYNPSLRTRNSFETGMTQLGGHVNYLSPASMYSPGTSETAGPGELVKESKEAVKLALSEFGSGVCPEEVYLRYRARAGGRMSGGIHFFVPFKGLDLPKTRITIRSARQPESRAVREFPGLGTLESMAFHVRASALSLFVCLDCPRVPGFFSDKHRQQVSAINFNEVFMHATLEPEGLVDIATVDRYRLNITARQF